MRTDKMWATFEGWKLPNGRVLKTQFKVRIELRPAAGHTPTSHCWSQRLKSSGKIGRNRISRGVSGRLRRTSNGR